MAEPTATREELEQLRKRKRLMDLEQKRGGGQSRYTPREQARISARAQASGLPTPNFDAVPDPANQRGAIQDMASAIDRTVDSFENFNPQPDAGINSPMDAFLFKGVNAVTGGGLQRAGNEAFEGTVQEGFGDRAVIAANTYPVGSTAGQMAGMGAQIAPAQRALGIAKSIPGIKQTVNAAGKTRLGSYAGRLGTGMAAWTGESALQGATTLAEEGSAYTGETPSIGDRINSAGQMAAMDLGDMGVSVPFVKDVPINVLGPIGASVARRAGTGIATQGASITPQGVRQSVQASTGRISGGPEQMRAVAEIIDAELAGGLRPQAIAAVHRLLKGSGLTSDDVTTLNREVRNRLDAGASSGGSRKTVGQLYSEILDDPNGPLYKPQASLNIVATLRERRMNSTPGDGSAGVIGSTLRDLRDTQKDFLEESAKNNLGETTRKGVAEQVEAVQNDISAEYERILAAAPAAGPGADTLRTLVKADPSKGSILRRRAKNAGLSVDDYIDKNPYAAAHWMRSRLSSDARSATGRERGDLLDTVSQLDEVLDGFDAYKATKQSWGTEQGVLNARDFGKSLFGGPNSTKMNDPGLRAELVDRFKALSPREQEVALISIRDAALGRMQGGPKNQQARLTALTSDAAIDFFEQIGAKSFSDDLMLIKDEQGFHNAYDPSFGPRTAPNQQAISQAPDLYGSTLSNAVRADGQGMGVIPVELAASQFAPGLSGWYAAYRGMKAAANKAFDLRNATKEDMTRFLMSRADPPRTNALATPPTSTPAPKVNALAVNPDEFFTDSAKGSAVMAPNYPSNALDDSLQRLGTPESQLGPRVDDGIIGLRQAMNEAADQFEQMVAQNPTKDSFVFSLPDDPRLGREAVERMLKFRDQRRWGAGGKPDTVLVISGDGGDLALVDRALTQRGGPYATTEVTQGAGVNWFRLNDLSDFDAVPSRLDNVATRGNGPIQNGLPGGTIAGAAIGGINPDFNQDGEVSFAERMAGIAGGAAVGRFGPRMASQADDMATMGVNGTPPKAVSKGQAQSELITALKDLETSGAAQKGFADHVLRTIGDDAPDILSPMQANNAARTQSPDLMREIGNPNGLKAAGSVATVTSPIWGGAALYAMYLNKVGEEGGPSMQEIMQAVERVRRQQEGLPPTPTLKPERLNALAL